MHLDLQAFVNRIKAGEVDWGLAAPRPPLIGQVSDGTASSTGGLSAPQTPAHYGRLVMELLDRLGGCAPPRPPALLGQAGYGTARSTGGLRAPQTPRVTRAG